MTREEIISGLKITVEMFLFDSSTGETITRPRNDMDKTTIDACRGAIELLEQQPKTGHWIFTKTKLDRHGCTAECSSCHKKWKTYDEIRFKKENNYCPNCGAKMVEPQESGE